MKKILVASLISAAIMSTSAFAENSESKNGSTTISHTSINQPQPLVSDEEKARFWGLSDDEWTKYQKYMELEGNLYYKHLTPINVMALIETNPERRNLYIAKHVVRDRGKVKNEISMANDAWKIQQAMYGDEDLVDFNSLPWFDPSYTGKTISLNISEENLKDPAFVDTEDLSYKDGDELILTFSIEQCESSGSTCKDQIKLMLKDQPLDLVILLIENDENSFNSFSELTSLPMAIETGKVRVEFLENKPFHFESEPSHNDIFHARQGMIINKL